MEMVRAGQGQMVIREGLKSVGLKQSLCIGGREINSPQQPKVLRPRSESTYSLRLLGPF